MRRIATVLLIAILALPLVGAKRRASGPTECKDLSAPLIALVVNGPDSGCGLNRRPCYVGEPIEMRVIAFAYSPSCGTHQATVAFGDGTVRHVGTARSLPVLEHRYFAAGIYRVFATISNGRSVATVYQDVYVGGSAP